MKAASSIVILVSALTLGSATHSNAQTTPGAGARLGELITSRLRAGGPFFTDDERAVIDRACGYSAGEWDGFELNTRDDVLICSNGRRVDTPEVRRVLDAARTRIRRRVDDVMESADVRGAIARITSDATARAMRAMDAAFAATDDED